MFEVSIDTFSFLPDEASRRLAAHGAEDGMLVATGTILLTIVFELVSLPTVRKVLKGHDGVSLYLTALALNFRNHYLFGVPVMTVAYVLFSREEAAKTIFEFSMRTFGIMFVHSFVYYSVHKAFHSSPKLYQYHRFHHRFHAHVPPASANAVSAVEYLLAYIFPFALGGLFFRPHRVEFVVAISIVSFCNLLVHMPCLEPMSEQYVFPFLVSTHDHTEHHKRLTSHYASPTLNWDWIIERMNTLTKEKKAA